MTNCCKLLSALFLLCSVFCHQAKASRQEPAALPNAAARAHIDSVVLAVRKIYLNNPDKARSLSQATLLLSKKINYRNGVAFSFLNMGIAYWAQSYYPISLFYLNSALNTFAKDDHEQRSDCYRSMARNYIDLRKYDQGLRYISLALAEAGSNIEEQERAISERSYAYLRLKRYDDALNDTRKAIKLCGTLDKTYDIAILYGRLSSILSAQKLYNKALLYNDTSFTLSLKTGNKRLRTTLWIGKAAIAYAQKDYNRSIYYADIAGKLADSLGVMEMLTRANHWAYKSYEAKGDKDKALAYKSNYILIQDSLNKLDKQNSLQLIQDYFSLNSKLNDIEQIERRERLNKTLIGSQRTTIVNLTIAVLCLLVVLYVGYRLYRQKQKLSGMLKREHQEVLKQNQLIKTQSQNLDDLNQLKDRLLAIIGHDLKSPLANVRSIVELFGQGYFSAEEVQGLMKDVSPAIEGAELTLSNLIEWAGSQIKGNNTILTTVSLQLVIAEIAQVSKHPLSQKNITLTVDMPVGQYVHADEHHVKMILRNLISNAIKFTPAGGLINITTEVQHNNLVIKVTDTGKGMTADEVGKLFSIHTHFTQVGTRGEKGTGIGLLLCCQLAELNHGHISATSVFGAGSVFYLTLPLGNYHLQL